MFMNISGCCLECYVCTTQEGNTEKCLRTIRTCEPEEDHCLTTISWGSMYFCFFLSAACTCLLFARSNPVIVLCLGRPYWTLSADKQYFVSKQCATKKLCEQTWNETLPYCERIWYLDWRCSECCQGDRCNYFVTVCNGSQLFQHLNNAVFSLLSMFTVISSYCQVLHSTHTNCCISIL